ncbi:RNA exonuclease 4-like [Pieris napi]|uniref:RNA exonuclease 4-like n=1 Tax=Pieris napi TaxID=78633 RepID=UPI001FB865DD|nr:RNA exonuclease 4-like [Pieris napi]
MVRVFAMDCERVQINEYESRLHRVTVVDEKCSCVMDRHIKPVPDTRHPSCRRQYSWAEPVEKVVLALKKIIKEEDVLVGFDVQKDLHDMGMFHSNVRDMAPYNALLESGLKESLMDLAFQELRYPNPGLHDSRYFSAAAMNIYQKYSF